MRPYVALTLHRDQIRDISLRQRVTGLRVYGSELHGDDTTASGLDLLVERKPAKGGAGFWGCSNFPRCESKLPMVAALR